MIKVLYFARLREQMGTGAETLEWTESLRTLDDLRLRLQQRHPEKQDVLQARDLLVARNQEMMGWTEAVEDGDEVALFPPVTGG